MLKLNVGSGPFPRDGWVNIDAHERNCPDVLASATDRLPFEDRSASHIYAGHVLEHIEPDKVLRAVQEFRRILTLGGTLLVVGPALELAYRFNAPQSDIDDILNTQPKDEPYDPKWHQWEATSYRTLSYVRFWFDTAELLTSPEDVRFVKDEDVWRPVDSAKLVRLTEEGWPITSQIYWQCAITATKEY